MLQTSRNGKVFIYFIAPRNSHPWQGLSPFSKRTSKKSDDALFKRSHNPQAYNGAAQTREVMLPGSQCPFPIPQTRQ